MKTSEFQGLVLKIDAISIGTTWQKSISKYGPITRAPFSNSLASQSDIVAMQAVNVQLKLVKKMLL